MGTKRETLLKSTLKKVFDLGGLDDTQEDLIEETFLQLGECLHIGVDMDNECLRCGEKLIERKIGRKIERKIGRKIGRKRS